MKILPALGLALLASCILSAQNYTSFFTGNLTDAVASPLGGVCLMGGATEDDNAMRWFLQRADGGDVLVIRASGSDGYNDYLYNQLGVSVNSVETILFNNALASADNYVLERIAQAEAIWIAGGDQYNYVSFWRNTAVASLINEGISQRNIVIGGTSAGMAILGSVYFTAENGTVTSSAALSNPYNTDMAISNLPFLRVPYLENVITDTHYDDPDRRGRHAAFLARATTDYEDSFFGIACDEFTAVCIDPNGRASVYGTFPDFDDNAYFLTPNCGIMNNVPENCSPGQPLSWDQGGAALKVYAVKGTPTGLYTFDLHDWRTGIGGSWQDWSVDNGSLSIANGSVPNCTPVRTSELQPTLDLKVFPNPTPKGEVRINIGETDAAGSVRLLDVSGRLIKEWAAVRSSDGLDFSNIKAGIYFMEYRSEAGRSVRRIVVR